MRRLVLSSVVLAALLPAVAQARSQKPAEPVRHPGLEALIKRFADEARKAKGEGERPRELRASEARTRS